MSLERHYNRNIYKVRKEARNFLGKIIITNSNKDILLLLSGGSVLSLYTTGLLGLSSRVTLGVLDERYSQDPKVNNFQIISHTKLFKKAKKAGCNFIDTSVKKDESIQQLTARFEEELRQWKKNYPDGIVIATQGMGPDGHTAGMMPYPEDRVLFDEQFENGDQWVVGYDAKNKNPYPMRVTTTIPFLREAVDVSIFYAAPPKKSDERKRKIPILKKILSKQNMPLHKYPASIIRHMKNVHLFTDIK